MEKDDTCWYSNKSYEHMLSGARGKMWPKLEKSSHWQILEKLLEIVCIDAGHKVKLLDIGCGAGALSHQKIIKCNFNYSGFDLLGIIDNVAKVFSPDANFLHGDITKDKLGFIKDYYVVVMSAFIDIMPDPVIYLKRILDECTNYTIIHRQFITDGPTYVEKKGSYGGTTYISHINELEFNKCASHFEIKRDHTGLGKNNYSYLLKRKRNEI